VEQDESEDLRRRIGELQSELDSLERERSRLDVALAQVDSTPPKKIELPNKGKLAVAFLVAPLVIGGVIVAVALGGGNSGAETLYGRVTRSSGTAPARDGTPCTIFLSPGDENYDAQIDVLCGGRIVYGGGTLGWIGECEERDNLPWRCIDPAFSDDGGDPKLLFDRAARSVRVSERNWRIDIELVTPPAGVAP
jgi:hypothetical protein